MHFQTIKHWNDEIWDQVSVIYFQAFENGAKPEHIIKNMFTKKICVFHLLYNGSDLLAFALSSSLQQSKVLIIDYIGVKIGERNNGTGTMLLNYIKQWVKENSSIKYIIIEVEAAQTTSNLERIAFWKKNDFILTDYVHHYKWVPESYRSMYYKLVTNASDIKNGEQLFSYITSFHKESFSKK